MANFSFFVVICCCVVAVSGVRPSSHAAGQRNTFAQSNPFSTSIDLPPKILLGEVFPMKIAIQNNANETLYLTSMIANSTEYEVLPDANQMAPEGAEGEQSTCVWEGDSTSHTFWIRPLEAGKIEFSVGVAVLPGQNLTCDGANSDDSIYIYTQFPNIKVEPEGFRKEKVWSKYVCGIDMRDGKDTLEEVQMEDVPEAVPGSVRAFFRAASTFMALVNQGKRSLLLDGRGDTEGLSAAANQYLKINYIGSERQELPFNTDEVKANVESAYKKQLKYRLPDNSYATPGYRNKTAAVSSWMTAYMLTVASLTSQSRTRTSEGPTRNTWMWLNTLQRIKDEEDGCFNSIGKMYHDLLRDETTDELSPDLFTAYTMVSLGISAWDGPLYLSLSPARKCILSEKNDDPFAMALKAHALGVSGYYKTSEMIESLLQVANETDDFIFWDVPNDSAGTNSEAIQTASYAAMAIMTRRDEFRPQLDKIIRWLASQMNSRGGFVSHFDSMMGVRALLAYERRELKLDLEVTVEAEDVNRTFTFRDRDLLRVRRTELPTLPTNVRMSVSGSGCGFLQTVVRYNDMTHYDSDAFSLSVNNGPNSSCGIPDRINICTAYLLNRISNLVAVEVTLVSGYSTREEDLQALVNGTNAFTDFEVKGNKITFLVDGLSAEETCVDFGVIREAEIENAKPGVVVVYDYYQPQFAKSVSYTIPPEGDCTRVE